MWAEGRSFSHCDRVSHISVQSHHFALTQLHQMALVVLFVSKAPSLLTPLLRQASSSLQSPLRGLSLRTFVNTPQRPQCWSNRIDVSGLIHLIPIAISSTIVVFSVSVRRFVWDNLFVFLRCRTGCCASTVLWERQRRVVRM